MLSEYAEFLGVGEKRNEQNASLNI